MVRCDLIQSQMSESGNNTAAEMPITCDGSAFEAHLSVIGQPLVDIVCQLNTARGSRSVAALLLKEHGLTVQLFFQLSCTHSVRRRPVEGPDDLLAGDVVSAGYPDLI